MIKDLITEAKQEIYLVNDIPVIVSREDLAYQRPLPPNAKMSALYEIVKHKAALGYEKMVMFAKKQQGIPYALGFPYICKEFNVTPIITYPATKGSKTPDIVFHLANYAVKYGAVPLELVRLHPNLVSININQSKKIAEDQGAYFIPFGFDDALSVDIHSKRFYIPPACKTIVMATMTGMTLAGAIKSAYDKWPYPQAERFPTFVGISCGRPPENVKTSMAKYIQLPNTLQVINPYERNIKIDIETPFPLHPDYELKAWKWMTDNIHDLAEPILFINVGA